MIGNYCLTRSTSDSERLDKYSIFQNDMEHGFRHKYVNECNTSDVAKRKDAMRFRIATANLLIMELAELLHNKRHYTVGNQLTIRL